ncbi:phosphoenolpyruvate carboxykinase (ATP) [Salisediminibacterium halotolerans]|uniref:Phosphoenolpyruvate carboxykinase (ATP) n=1 Tax=Salisediminibacterium halotolerans TaxID=517425 RepID=A0A1H9UWR1_9BACI|nr:phosphoenolpyruvate carboxykinase (ATP) [Salisediminibacterium haloalkalitolerans]SES13876.1 phosphoenolpyruvate carboxykinase (ATP) [Salisediminibacterium haloalkalitolerans]
MSMLHFDAELTKILQGENCRNQLPTAALVEKSLERGEGILSSTGALRVLTAPYTGRSPRDKFIVDELSVRDEVDWGNVNCSVSEKVFDKLYRKVLDHLQAQDELFVRIGIAGADPDYQLPIRIVNERAWHNMFVQQLFLRPDEETAKQTIPEFTILSAPSFKAVPDIDGTRSEAFIIVSMEKKIVLIGGTEYAGEMKKSIFSVMNHLMPKKGVLPMHCSANIGPEGDAALFFGLSGTGKTTLSAEPERSLIGDDEHGWSANGIFNFEGGCYAKCIDLCGEKEPEIFQAIRFGAVLENVVLDKKTRNPDYCRSDYTENTRVAYPIDHISNAARPSIAGHPSAVIFLTADAFGVLPPISRLTRAQAMYHFLSGYTSKLAGTERGITSPQATFSTCFGAPFLPLHPTVYAEMLGNKMLEHNTDVYLVNTGWSGGAYGTGERIALKHTRAMIRAALNGELDSAETVTDPFFGLSVPVECPGVPDHILLPRETWNDPADYDLKARELADKFRDNFKKYENVPEEIRRGGPPA